MNNALTSCTGFLAAMLSDRPEMTDVEAGECLHDPSIDQSEQDVF